MSLAQLFYAKETFRERVRQWRQACFRNASRLSRSSRDSRLTHHPSQFSLEALEPRVLLSATPTEAVACRRGPASWPVRSVLNALVRCAMALAVAMPIYAPYAVIEAVYIGIPDFDGGVAPSPHLPL